MSETRSSKKATEPSAEPIEVELTEDVLPTTTEEHSPLKTQRKTPRIKVEKPTLELSEDEIADILEKRLCKSAASEYIADKSKDEKEKVITRKETKPFDLKVLSKDKFSMTTVLNKQRFDQFDRLLRANDLYTMATKTRLPPIPTPSNEFGYSKAVVSSGNGKYSLIPADNIANYDYDLTRLETMIYTAFDRALYHQSQGFIDHDPVVMYADLHAYFYNQDSHGIKAARVALDKYKINPSISLRADITLFEEVIRNVEFAAEGVILEKIKQSIIDEKFNQDTRIGVRERLVHSQVNHLSYRDTLEELKSVPNASVVPSSNHRMMALLPKTELCNNHAKGRCTFGDRCKYSHDSQGPAQMSKPIPMKAIQDAAPPPPPLKKPPAPAGAPPKPKAMPPTYIEERHRSFMGQPKGLLSPTNPLGYSRKQYVVLKHLQVQESNDWNLPTATRGPRDSNGNAYLGMFQCIQSPEPSIPPTPSSQSNVQYQPPPLLLPRSAPYAEANIRDTNLNGYNYDHMRSPTPTVPESPVAVPTDPEEYQQYEEIYCYDHSAPRKRVISEDSAEYLRKTILVFDHCLRHAPLSRCFKGYTSFVYDEKPDDPTRPLPFTRVVNILGWKSISPLHHPHHESLLPIYRGDPHVLELLQMIGNVFLHASTTQHPPGVPLTAGSYNSFSPFANTFNHQPDYGSYTSSVIAIIDYVYYFNTVFAVSTDDPTRPYLYLAIIYDFMAFTSQYYRRALDDRAPTPTNMRSYEHKLKEGICTMATRAVISQGGQREFDDLLQVFYSIAENACPIPAKVPDTNSTLYATPTNSRKRALDDCTEAMFKVPRYDLGHGHDNSTIPEEEEAELLFSPMSHPRPHSEVIDLSKPSYPSIPAPDDLLDTDEVLLEYFAAVPMNAMSMSEKIFIMDSGAGRTGTSDLSVLKNVKPSTATTVTGAFGPTITATHTGSFGPHNLDAVYIQSMGPQTLVSLSQFCNAGNKFVGVFTDTEYRMYDRASAEPALKLLATRREAERGNVRNGVYVRS